MNSKKAKIISAAVCVVIVATGLFAGWYFLRDNKNNSKLTPHPLRPESFTVESEVSPEGVGTMTFYSYPKYYKDEKGEFRPVDTTIKKAPAGVSAADKSDKSDKSDGSDVFVGSDKTDRSDGSDVPHKSYGISVAKAAEENFNWQVTSGVWRLFAGNNAEVLMEHLRTSFKTKPVALAFFDKSTKKYAIIERAKEVKPVVAANQIIWPGIFKGVDHRVTYINDMLKEDIEMASTTRITLPAPEKFGIAMQNAYVGFLYDVDASGLKDLYAEKVEDNRRAPVKFGVESIETEGKIEFFDKDNYVFETIEAGYVNVSKQSLGSQEIIFNNNSKKLPLLKRFFSENNQYKFFYGVDRKKTRTLGQGNLIFDPTLSFQKGDGGNYSEVDDTCTLEGVNSTNYGALDSWYVLTTSYVNYGLVKFPNLIGSLPGQVPASSNITSANLFLKTASTAPAGTGTIVEILDQWVEGNGNAYFFSPAANPGIFGATYNNVQDKYNSETAYINMAGGISSSDTSVTVDNGSSGPITISDWPPQGLIKIDSEIMWYDSRTSSSFRGLKRGINGTSAATHNDNATVNGTVAWRGAGPTGSSIGATVGGWSGLVANTTYSFNITSAVQDWSNNPNINYGLRLSDTNNNSSARFISSEDTSPLNRPKLVVSYTVGAQGQSGEAGNIMAYESYDTAVSPTSPGLAATSSVANIGVADSGYLTTASSTANWGYDSQVFKYRLNSSSSPEAIKVTWQGHGESATTSAYNVSMNIWNFNSSQWEELASSSARFNDTFTDKSSKLTSGGHSMIFATSTIFVGGCRYLEEYNPNTDAGREIDLISIISSYCIMALVYDPVDQTIYFGSEKGKFGSYNTVTGGVSDLTPSFWGAGFAIYGMAFDAKNNKIYFGGQGADSSARFARYDPITATSTNLILKISSFWGANDIKSLTYDSLNGTIYLTGGSDKFAVFDPVSNSAKNLTSILSIPSSPWSMVYDANDKKIFVAARGADIKSYAPLTGEVEDISSYVPPALSATAALIIHSAVYDSVNKTLYFGGQNNIFFRYFPKNRTSSSLTNDVLDSLGWSTATSLYGMAFDPNLQAVYLGQNGKFGKMAVAQNTDLSSTLTSNISNYFDSSGNVWIWVKADNEYSPPTITCTGSSNCVSPGDPGFANTATFSWTTNEGANEAVAYEAALADQGAWANYANTKHDDNGWAGSHSVNVSDLTCDPATTYQYRVRSCDRWGTCTISSNYSFTTNDCSGGGGTCPHLYLWDGKKWDFKTNTFGSGGLAKLQGGVEGFVKPIPNQIYTFDTITPNQDGKLEVREFSDLNEINYFDRLKLYSVFVPEDYTLASENPTIGSPPGTKPKLHTFKTDLTKLKNAKIIDGASDSYSKHSRVLDSNEGNGELQNNQDITDLISENDDKYLALGKDPENYSYKTIELDFGNLSDKPVKKLVVLGDSSYPQTKEGVLRRGKSGKPERLYVQDKNSQWVEVPKEKANFVKPSPFEIYQVYDISNIFISDNYKIRIKYLYKTYLNQIAIDFTPDYSPLEKTEIQPNSMVLRGYDYFHPFDEDGGRPDYGLIKERDRSADYPGFYTRYGDVAPLMKEADDKFVVLAKGDEVAATFDIPKDQVPSGMKRAYVVDTYGFYKAEGKSQVPMIVDPLPFAAMSNFPYPDEEYPYTNDADYQKYLKEWNTRYIGPDKPFSDYLPLGDQIAAGVLADIQKAAGLISKATEFLQPKDKPSGQYTEIDESVKSNSLDTDYLGITVEERGTTIKGGIRIKGGVRIK